MPVIEDGPGPVDDGSGPAPPPRIRAHLVTGGSFHDFDFARQELLSLLAEHAQVRTTVGCSWRDLDAIDRADMLVSYTCDLRPDPTAQEGVRRWVEAGGRWLALHGTNAALDLPRPDGIEAPRCFPMWVDTLGSQFIAHPPIIPFRVEVSRPDHWLVRGVESFDTDDELYLSEYPDRASLEVLLHTTYTGHARGFAESDWTSGDPVHPVQYLRHLGNGAVLYNTLGHCRGHYDMAPITDYYPKIERCSWNRPEYYELLRRGIRWAMGHNA